MKNLKKFFLVLIIIPCIFLLNGCSLFNKEDVYVTDIVQTEIVGDVATYTIYYSNGETSLLTVNNGKDGEDASSPSIEEIYQQYVEEHGEISFADFLKQYLTINQEDNTVEKATNIALQSAVTIWCEFPVSDYYQNKDTSVACGSGVIYKMNETYSYIITNYHVVYYSDCDTVDNIANKIHIFQYGTSELAYELTTKDGSGNTSVVTDENGYPKIAYGDGAVEAEFIGGALNYDIAVLKVKTEDLKKYNEHVKAVTIADGYNISEKAIAIGNPECEGFSVTSGIISVESETITMTGADDITECDFRVMRIDTAVNGGNSGGGLFNINGELIGIVNAKAISSDIDNIAYAIPYDNATKVADNIIYYYNGTNSSTVKKLVLDITYSVENGRAIYDPKTNSTTLTDDLVVASVTTGGIGNLMGIQAGDIIKSISINGETHTLTRSYQLPDLLLTIRAGDKIILTVARGESTKELGIVTEQGILESYLQTVA